MRTLGGALLFLCLGPVSLVTAPLPARAFYPGADAGCERVRAMCLESQQRCESENSRRVREEPASLIVPCDLEHDLCLGRCRPPPRSP